MFSFWLQPWLWLLVHFGATKFISIPKRLYGMCACACVHDKKIALSPLRYGNEKNIHHLYICIHISTYNVYAWREKPPLCSILLNAEYISHWTWLRALLSRKAEQNWMEYVLQQKTPSSYASNEIFTYAFWCFCSVRNCFYFNFRFFSSIYSYSSVKHPQHFLSLDQIWFSKGIRILNHISIWKNHKLFFHNFHMMLGERTWWVYMNKRSMR